MRSVAKDTGIPQAFTDYREMLEKVQPDITVVATPNIFHKPMTLAALEAGSHVLCEKPLALTYADAKEMMDFAAEKGKILTVGTHYRYSAPMQAAKAHVDAGFFGEIYAARTVWQRRAGIPGYGSWFTNRDLAGGGSLLDIGVHALDRVLYLMGYPEAVSVTGASYDKLGKLGVGLGGWGLDISKPGAGVRYDVDDLTWAFVRFANGVSLIFQVAWASHLPEQFFAEVYGTKGGANVTNREGRRPVYGAERAAGAHRNQRARGQGQFVCASHREFVATPERRCFGRHHHAGAGAVERAHRRRHHAFGGAWLWSSWMTDGFHPYVLTYSLKRRTNEAGGHSSCGAADAELCGDGALLCADARFSHHASLGRCQHRVHRRGQHDD